MSQKQISELPLLATVVDDINFVGDNGVQTYKLTALKIYDYLKTKIYGQNAETSPAVGDTLSIYDASDSDFKKMTLENLLKVVAQLTAETGPATGDYVLIYDSSASAVRKMSLENLLTLLNSLTAETAPSNADSLLIYDASATAVRKMTLENILNVLTSLTAVTPASDDYAVIIDTSDSNKSKKVLISSLTSAPAYRSVTTTDSVGAGDETMKLSGASFTSTLPTAVGATGKIYKFVHAGTSLTQLYTLATTSSQTINGIAGGSYILCTFGEVLTIQSDGANWLILEHYAQTDWAAYTPGSYQGIGTPSNVNFNWRRNGPDLLLRGYLTLGTNTASEMRIALPGGATTVSTLPTLQIAGPGSFTVVGADHYDVVLIEASKTYLTFGVQYSSNQASLSKTNGNFYNNGGTYSFVASVPIDGFRP